MSSIIKLRSSSFPGLAPTTSQLELGELAINTYDAKLYLKQKQEEVERIIEISSSDFSYAVENTIFVQKGGSDSNDGTSITSAVLTIERAVQIAKKRNRLTLISVSPGVYESKGHIDLADDTLIVSAHRSVIIKPKPGFEERNVFRMGSGCFIEGMIFENWRLDSLDNPSEGFAVSFRPGANIRRAPYAHKIAVRTKPFWDVVAPPLDRENSNPLVGRGGGVAIADASVLNTNSIYPNIMTWGATPVSHNGIGYVAKNGGLINAVNAVSMWGHKHFLASDGGQLVLSSCTTQFGDYSLVSQGVRNIVDPYLPDIDLQIKENAANSILLNKDNIIDAMWSHLSSIGYQGYDSVKCRRDVGLILSGIINDLILGTNYWAITNGLSYLRASANLVISDQKSQTVGAIQYLRDKTIELITDSQGITRIQNSFNIILDILENGNSAVPPLFFTNIGEPKQNRARLQLQNNKQFIIDQLINWIDLNYPGLDYNQELCRRDAGYIIDAFSHDINYDTNIATILNAKAYFIGNSSNLPESEIIPTGVAIRQLGVICSSIAQGTYEGQDLSAELATSIQGDKIRNFANIISRTLLEGNLESLPLEELISDDCIQQDFILISKIIEDNIESLKKKTLTYVNYEYAFLDENFTKRDAGTILQALYWTLLSANGKPFADLAKGLFDTVGKRVFVESPFDYEISLRDTLLITEAIKYDILFGSNFRSIRAAQAFYRANASNAINKFKNETIYAITRQKEIIGNILSSNSLLRSNNLFDEMINILENGKDAASSFVIPDPPDFDTGFFNARRLLGLNKTFIQNEIDSWIAHQVANGISPFTSDFTYNVEACRRDVGMVIDSLTYDLTYRGNLETINAANAYFRGAKPLYGVGEKKQTIAAYQRLKEILGNILQNITITRSQGNTTVQNTSGTPGSGQAALFAQDRIDDIIGTISSDGRPPRRLLPNINWPDVQYQNSFQTILSNKREITRNVMIDLNKEYKTVMGAFVFSFESIESEVKSKTEPSSHSIIEELFKTLTNTVVDPRRLSEPSIITAIGHTWTGVMSGVALTQIPPVRNETKIDESILEIDRGQVIASGQDDEGSALFVGGLEISGDTGELGGPPFDTAVNRVATRAAIARSF